MDFVSCVFLLFTAAGCCIEAARQEPKLQRGDVTFEIVTRDHRQPQTLSESNLEIVKRKRTIINISGWMHNTTAPTSYFPNITEQYLKKGDYNIILVHADKLMFLSQELVSASYTDAIGNCVGDLIIDLYESDCIFLENIHIVGHALGAHIAGATGRRVQKKLSTQIYRITALEVSKVGFENAPPSKRLDKSDAIVVDVIHTAAGQVGLNQSVGSADFWPNGGTAPQPGCDAESQYGIYCSHDKSIWYFIYTIRSCIRAEKCNSYEAFKRHECSKNPQTVFGDNYKGRIDGNFYLNLDCCTEDCTSSIE